MSKTHVPRWKLKLLLLAAAWMLVQGRCGAQVQDDGVAHPAQEGITAPNGAKSGASRGGSPTPYQPPFSVQSAAGGIAPFPLPTPQTVVIPPTAPSFAGSCDSAGCWGSDGTRYNAIGGSLVRPDGRMCQNVGGVMQCP